MQIKIGPIHQVFLYIRYVMICEMFRRVSTSIYHEGFDQGTLSPVRSKVFIGGIGPYTIVRKAG